MLTASILVCLIISTTAFFPLRPQYAWPDYQDYLDLIYNDESSNIDINIKTKENKVKVHHPDDLTCRDEVTGENLDWFTLYKLPKRTEILETSQTKNEFIYNGTAYTYMSNKSQKEWTLSNLSMNDTSSLAGKTLQVLYKTDFESARANKTRDNIGYILYNDQADKVTMTHGHTKGVILFNERSAIWIVHSIPHFPPKPSDSGYQIHHSQCIYGQQFFCMSIKLDELKKIGEQFEYTYPQIYDHHIPEDAKDKAHMKNLLNVIEGNKVETSPWSNIKHFTTVGGEKLLSFAKYTNYEDDLYSGLVAPYLQSNINTETWNNGRGTLESNCSSSINYQVHNVEQVFFNSIAIRFSVHHDHSKWAVTTSKQDIGRKMSKEKKIACVGDINRQEEQFKRGGGTVCFMDNENVWNQYSKLVAQVEPCKRKFKRENLNALDAFRKLKKTQGKRFRFKDSKHKIVMLG